MTDSSKPTVTNTLSGGTFRPHAIGVACPNEPKKGLGEQAVAIPAFPPHLGAKPK